MPLRMYNLNEVHLPQVEEPLQAAISTESSLSDFDATLEPVVEKATATSSKGKKPMTSKQAFSWLPKRVPSKVELPSNIDIRGDP